MDPPFSGFVLDPAKCRKLSMEEKRELVRELSKWPESAPEKLQTWSRRDLIEILCTEIGKERKYTGITKQKMIENLFQVVSGKQSVEKDEDMNSTHDLPKTNSQSPAKRHRKNDQPSRSPIVSNTLSGCDHSDASSVSDIRYCKNLACRAALIREDMFCKRCSCCICHKYDDNKDPSLWLFCSSEAPSQASSCGLSCHIECALKHDRAGIMKNGKPANSDGNYLCIYCGKANELLGCWKRQLIIAKDARRVDVLCHRIYLTHRLLGATERYQELLEIVDSAMKKLEMEVGAISGFSNMARGIVNRLSVGAEVQKMCASAVELLDNLLHSRISSSTQVPEASDFIKFEDISPTSLNLILSLEDFLALSTEVTGFTFWHRRADTMEYLKEPTCTLFSPKKRALITELTPATKYIFKVSAFNGTKELGTWELEVATEEISTDGSMNLILDETTLKSQSQNKKENCHDMPNQSTAEVSNDNRSECADLNRSPEFYYDCYQKPEILDSGNLFDQAQKEHENNKCMDIVNGPEVVEHEVIEPEVDTPEHWGSALDEEPNSTIQIEVNKDTPNLENKQASDTLKSENDSNAPMATDSIIVPSGSADNIVPATPCHLESSKDGSGRRFECIPRAMLYGHSLTKPDAEPGSSSKKRGKELFGETCIKHGSLEVTYEYCVKVIRWLEREGYIETDFRVKFLTWFSLRATLQEKRVVNVFVDTLIDDPASLAGQLVDTFSEAVYRKRSPPVPNGFCRKLWH